VTASHPDEAAVVPSVARCLSSFATRSIPGFLTAEVATDVARPARLTDLLVPGNLTSVAALQQFSEICGAASDTLLNHLRIAMWLQSHFLGLDLASFCGVVVAPEYVHAVLDALTDPAESSSMPVQEVVGKVQRAAAAMFDAQLAVDRWRSLYNEAVRELLRYFASCERALSDSLSTAVKGVQQWVDDAVDHTKMVMDTLSGGILSLEISRTGKTWSPGIVAFVSTNFAYREGRPKNCKLSLEVK
jgi:hypothetical protein